MKIKVLLKNGLLGGLAITAVCIIHLRRPDPVQAAPEMVHNSNKPVPDMGKSQTSDLALVSHPTPVNYIAPQ